MNRKFALTGYPLGHTMSPPIHTALFEMAGRQGSYEVCEIPPDQADRLFPAMLREYDGFNVTIPHKQAVIPYLDRLDGSAKRYGAVNVVACAGTEKIGYNTDVDGFLRAVEAMGAVLRGHDILLLGCGGAGRMIAIESAWQGASSVTIAVRESDLPAANELAEKLWQVRPSLPVTVTLLDAITGRYHLMVNATPVGMYPHTGAAPVKPETLRQVEYLLDIIYNPAETLLMRYAKEAGVPYSGGMAMLVWQAVAAHEIWDGDRYPVPEVERLIRKMEEKMYAG